MAVVRTTSKRITAKSAFQCLLVLLVLSAANCCFAYLTTGSYIGDGNGDREIVGLGFQPDFVLIKGNNSAATICRTATMEPPFSRPLALAESLSPGQILSLDEDGFTVGNNLAVNSEGILYFWTAVSAEAGNLALGSYVGNDTWYEWIDGIGFRPGYVIIIPQEDRVAWQRSQLMPMMWSCPFDANDATDSSILNFNDDGFAVGDEDVNASGEIFHYLAWRSMPGEMATGSFFGEDAGHEVLGLGFEPALIVTSTSRAAIRTFKPASAGVDTTLPFGEELPFSGGITEITDDGFIIGSHESVTETGATVHWTAFAAKLPPTADLAVDLVVDPPEVAVGDTVSYELAVTNEGPDTAANIVAAISLSENVTFLSAIPQQGTYDETIGLWSIGTVAAGETISLVVATIVSAGLPGENITTVASIQSSDTPDPDATNDADSAVCTVETSTPVSIICSEFNGEDRVLQPGQTSLEIMRLVINNGGLDSLMLQTLSLTNLHSGEGSQLQHDADWELITLLTKTNSEFGSENGGAEVASGVFEAGRLTFDNLNQRIARGDSLIVEVRGLVSLSEARDGDRLQVAVASADDMVFNDVVEISCTWPLAAGGEIVIDGMVADQITLHAIGTDFFPVGSTRNLALDMTIPANGLDDDELNGLHFVNGEPSELDEMLTRMEVWADDGDALFEVDGDALLGEVAHSNEVWFLSGLAVPIPASEGLRLFVTIDVDAESPDGSIRLTLPADPDLRGILVASANDGPTDEALAYSSSQSISAMDRVIFSAGDLAWGETVPGQSNVPLLHLTALNIHDGPRTLQRLVVTNATSGIAGASQASLDSTLSQLKLRLDGDNNGVLGDPDVDPVIATANFNAGVAIFDGLAWELPANSTACHLFLTGSVSLAHAADGDTLAVMLAGPDDLVFNEEDETVIAGDWPLNSGARRIVNGMVAAQIGNHPIPPVALSGGDGPVLALDLTVPANGSRPDTLQSIQIVEHGTATETDLETLLLWYDGGDGEFTGGGDDVQIGELTYSLGSWFLPGMNLEVPAGGLRLFVSLQVSTTPEDSATVNLALPTNGLTMTSNNDGPHDEMLRCATTLLLSNAPLLSDFDLERLSSTIDQQWQLRMIVNNRGTEGVDDIQPSALLLGGTGMATVDGPPSPASFNLAGGAVDTFTWTLTSTEVGELTAGGNCQGTSAIGGVTRSSLYWESEEHRILLPAQQLGLYPVTNMPFSIIRGQQNVVPLTLTLDNPGGEDIAGILLQSMTIRLNVTADGDGIVPADLLDRVVVNEGLEIYVRKNDLETGGDTVELILDPPALITNSEPVTLGLRLDISPDATAETFVVSIISSDCLNAIDAVNGNAVDVVLNEGEFPIISEPGHLVGEATGLNVTTGTNEAQTAGQGQTDIPLLALLVQSEGSDPLSSDARIGSFGITLESAAGETIDDVSHFIERVRVVSPLQIVAEREITGPADSSLIFELMPQLTIPVGSQPMAVTVYGDIPAGADLGAFRVRLHDIDTFDVRDANLNTPLNVYYDPGLILGGVVNIEALATEVRLSGSGLLPAMVALGDSDVPVFDCVLRHPGTVGTAAIRIDTLCILCRDASFEPVAAGTILDRIRLRNGDELVSDIAPGPGDTLDVVIPLTNFELTAGQTVTLRLSCDIDAGADLGSMEILLAADGLHAVDANLGSSVSVLAEADVILPIVSGLTHVSTPADELVVAFVDLLPPIVATSVIGTPAAELRLTNPAVEGTGPITVIGLTLRAADADFTGRPIGAAVNAVSIYADDELWAETTSLGVGDSTAVLTGNSALVIQALQHIALEAVLYFRDTSGIESFRLGVRADDIIVAQPGGGLLTIDIEPVAGSVFPYWTEAATFSIADLKSSYSNFPNPFAAGREQTHFVFNLPREATVSLRILTPRGEVVGEILPATTLGAGLHQQYGWDGRNGRGMSVRSGVYLAELMVRFADGGQERILRKVAVVR